MDLNFKAGDTIKVYYKIKEGEQTRTQAFEGVVLAVKGQAGDKTFTVRHIGADNVGVERIFPLSSPNLEKVELLRQGRVRRAKVYFVRNLSPKEVRKKLS
ncbi:MAG: 50S ribosomal protein L19 [Patescibacteria group bacterium]|nr:50S ribosomal protein L19 [Patescibacteria group bacterium]